MADDPSVKPTKKAARPRARKAGDDAGQTVLLSGGNPQIPKGEGDGPVQAYIAAMPGWKSDVGRRLDAIIERTVPGVRKAVKWNSPLYGAEGEGWFLSFHCFAKYIKDPSSAARRSVPFRPARPSRRRSATSTSTRGSWTKPGSPTG